MKNATSISLVLDRSGSISDCLAAMQSALDEFIESQKKVDGECELSIFQFDTVYEMVYRKPIKKAPKHKIVPRGMTALHDAIGKTIVEVGDGLAKLDEKDRPDKVIVVIITDGLENSSEEFNAETVKKLVTEQREKYKWEFVFLGANQDAVLTASTFGIPARNAASYNYSGVRSMGETISSNVRGYRISGQSVNMAFSDDQRKSLVPDDEEEKKSKTVSGKK